MFISVRFFKLADKMPVDHYKLMQAALRKRLKIEEWNKIIEANKNRTYGPWKLLCAEILDGVSRWLRQEERGLLLLVCRSWHETLPRPTSYVIRSYRVPRDLAARCPDIEDLELHMCPYDADWDHLVGLNLKRMTVRGRGVDEPADLSRTVPLIAKKELQWLMLCNGGFRNTSALVGLLPHLQQLHLICTKIKEADLVQLFEVLPSGCLVFVQPVPKDGVDAAAYKRAAAAYKRAAGKARFPTNRVKILKRPMSWDHLCTSK